LKRYASAAIRIRRAKKAMGRVMAQVDAAEFPNETHMTGCAGHPR